MASTAKLRLTIKASAFRAASEVFLNEAVEARKQMLGSVQDEQRSFWTGAYHAYTRAARALSALADEHEESSDGAVAP